jgi:3D (Asp-Asp-Asp) domain-containing protein
MGINETEALNFMIDPQYTSKTITTNLNDCPIVTFFDTPDQGSYIKYITTFNWTDNGCSGLDGKVRKGKNIVTYTGFMNVPGSIATITFQGFTVNNNKIDGFQQIKYVQPNVYELYTNLEIQFADQSTSSLFLANLTKTLVQGSGTATTDDDVWQFSGTFSGKTSEDVSWTGSVTQPLVKKGPCKWIDSGIISITDADGYKSSIDFGNGSCDNIATLKAGSKSTNFEMK